MAKKKKKFFEVEIPFIKDSVDLYAFEIEELEGRSIKLDMTRLLRGKGVEVSFRVGVSDSRGFASPNKARLLPYFIRRVMRKRASYVEDSFKADCIDSVLLIKPFLIARKNVSRAVRNALRVTAKEYLEEYVKDRTSEEILSDVVFGRMQRGMLVRLKKVYPLAFCEVRHVEVLEKKPDDVIVSALKSRKVSAKAPSASSEDASASDFEDTPQYESKESLEKESEKSAEKEDESLTGLKKSGDLENSDEEVEKKSSSKKSVKKKTAKKAPSKK